MAFEMKHNNKSFPFKSDEDAKKDKKIQPNVTRTGEGDNFATKAGKFLGNMLIGGAEEAGLIGRTNKFTLNLGKKDAIEKAIDVTDDSDKTHNMFKTGEFAEFDKEGNIVMPDSPKHSKFGQNIKNLKIGGANSINNLINKNIKNSL